MELKQFTSGGSRFTRRYEYDDSAVIAADLGAEVSGTVDVVGDTAIVVTDEGEFELDLPAEPAGAFIKNGVLTSELEAEE